MLGRSLLAVTLGGASLVAVLPGPATSAPKGDAILRNAECERCHADEAREWRGSMHRMAHYDPAYQRAPALEPLPLSPGCHAPAVDPTPDRAPARPGPLRAAPASCHSPHRTATVPS